MEDMFKWLDTDSRGVIDEEAFMRLRGKSAALDEVKLRTMFKQQVPRPVTPSASHL